MVMAQIVMVQIMIAQIVKSDMHVDVPCSRPPLPMPGQDLFVWSEHLDRKRKMDYYLMHILAPAQKIYPTIYPTIFYPI